MNRWFLIGLALTCLTGMSGCRRTGTHGESAQAASELPDTEAMAQEWTLENLLEEETDLLNLSSIWEMTDEETAEWGKQFDAQDVKKLIYTNQGEIRHEYEINDPAKIGEFFDALSRIMLGGVVEGQIGVPGDEISFIMNDGKTYSFLFEMGCLLLGDEKYETDEADDLWNLTSELLAEDL